MSIKNYTSSVPAIVSISRIEQCLARCGVIGVQKEFGPGGEVTAVCFQVKQGERILTFRLPADPEAVKKAMLKSVKRPRKGTESKISNQAHRTAWKLMLDWTEVQMSLVELQKVDVLQVFLPYTYDPVERITFYESLKKRGFKALPEHCE